MAELMVFTNAHPQTDGKPWGWVEDPTAHLTIVWRGDEGYHAAKKLVACWNAVKAAGGDPAIVAEALDALSHLVIEAPKQTVTGSVDAMTFSAAMNKARAVLRRARRVP